MGRRERVKAQYQLDKSLCSHRTYRNKQNKQKIGLSTQPLHFPYENFVVHQPLLEELR